MADKQVNNTPPAVTDVPAAEAVRQVADADLGQVVQMRREEAAGPSRRSVVRAIQQRLKTAETRSDVPTLTADELAPYAQGRWNTRQDVVRAALHYAGVQRISLADADELVPAFRDMPQSGTDDGGN